jgi:beta-N-acetylhexosaminidase
MTGMFLATFTASALLAGCASGGGSAPTTGHSAAGASSAQSSAPASASAVAAGCPAVAKMPVRQKVAQLVMVGVTGATQARAAVNNYQVGGIFIGSWTDQGIYQDQILQGINTSSRIPLMISIDEEGGRVSRLPGANLPSARVMGKTMSAVQIQAEGLRVGKMLKAAGINVDFAPDADVTTQPDDDVIGDRSFGSTAQQVTTDSRAFAAGLRAAGVMPVFKHFPGHGHATGDSHVDGVSTPSLAQMQNIDLAPFRAAVDDPTTEAVMVGHLTVPGLTDGLPASLSQPAMTVLRTGKGYNAKPFKGVIFTDDLTEMGAISKRYSVPTASVKAIEAGADIALAVTTDSLGATIDALAAAVNTGQLPKAFLDAKVMRVLSAKGQLHC